MSKALPHLPRRWWSIDLPGYRDHPDTYATYSAFDYDMLPPIGRELDADLAWLRGEPVMRGSLGERADGDPDPTREATAEQLGLQLDGREVALPRTFSAFIGSTEPLLRIRSATACYLDLAEFVVPVVGGGWLIHFMSDQQWVLHWLLYSGPDGSEAVVVTDEPLGFEADDDSRRKFGHEFDPSKTDAAVCAETLSVFLYRFWIENQIWFVLTDPGGEGRRLTDEQSRYTEHYRLRKP